jgi:hypothetical protein
MGKKRWGKKKNMTGECKKDRKKSGRWRKLQK